MTVYCDFESFDGTARTCRVCGRVVASSSARIAARCRLSKSGSAATLLTKAKNFAVSAGRHLAAGAPQASEEEVARRFAICETCEHFDGRACKKCGCPVVREKQFLSKLSWAGESCPVGKWGPAAS